MKKKYNTTVKTKLLANVVIVAIAISIAILIVGFQLYDSSIKKIYNNSGYSYGEMILSAIDTDKVKQYSETWEEDEDYPEFKQRLTDLHESAGTAYTYIVVPLEDGRMRYIYDSSGMELGSYDPMDKGDLIAPLEVYKNGIKPDSYFIRHSATYGYLTSSMLPVRDSQGKICAVLFVDTSMDLIASTIRNFILLSIIIASIITIIFVFIFMYIMQKSIVRPLVTIRDEAVEFGKAGTGVSKILNTIDTHDEIEDVASAMYKMENDILLYVDNLQKVTAEKERIGAELNIATQIQQDMLPHIFPALSEFPQIDLFASMDPAKEVGGDFYDFFKIDDTHMGLVMADVSGKGVPAALFMVISKTLVKNQTVSRCQNMPPSQILSIVNNQLCEGNDANLFCTCWLGILDVETGNMMCSSAGHEYPALRNTDGRFELFKEPHGPALAVMEDITYKDYEITLEPGSALFVYTDGVPEATRADDVLFETDRMITALNINPMASPQEILSTVRSEIDKFVDGAPQFDDITMLCMCYKGNTD